MDTGNKIIGREYLGHTEIPFKFENYEEIDNQNKIKKKINKK